MPLPAAAPSPAAAALTQNREETEGGPWPFASRLPVPEPLPAAPESSPVSWLPGPGSGTAAPGGVGGWGVLGPLLEGVGWCSVPLRQDLLQGGTTAFFCGGQLLGCLWGVGGPFVWLFPESGKAACPVRGGRDTIRVCSPPAACELGHRLIQVNPEALSTGGWLLRGRVFLLDQVQGQHPIRGRG